MVKRIQSVRERALAMIKRGVAPESPELGWRRILMNGSVVRDNRKVLAMVVAMVPLALSG